MSLRVQAAHWFELLVPRPQLSAALDLLAHAGQVELEGRPAAGWTPIDVNSLRPLLDQAKILTHRFAPLWPEPRLPEASIHPLRAEARLRTAIGSLQGWEQAAAPTLAVTERLTTERADCAHIADFLRLLDGDQELNFGRLVRPGDQLDCLLLAMLPDTIFPQDLTPLLVKRIVTEGLVYALVLGPKAVNNTLSAVLGGREARLLRLPDWISGTAAQALAQVRGRIGAIDSSLAEQRKGIDKLSREYSVAAALGELRELQWLTDQLSELATSEHLVRITGWTLLSSPSLLLAPLLQAGIAAVAGFAPAPSGYLPPTRMDNPRWARPFELFVRLLGIPGGNEADPSRLVAWIAPLLFGYMFGDLGQGLVLFAIGFWARRRWPAAAMLIPGGLVAAVCGCLFGSVFTVTGLVGPLWTDPLARPLLVLAVPLAFGGLLIVLGQALDGLSSAWSARFGSWLRSDAGLLLIYLGAWALLADRRAGAIGMTVGGLWHVLAPLPPRQWSLLPSRVGGLLEGLLRLAVNTLSFIRVGAFALGHAGLSLAVMALAHSVGWLPGRLVLLVAGNLLILSLEGLVVGVQTTRLLLFEFFVRFVRGEGRLFRPLAPPSPG